MNKHNVDIKWFIYLERELSYLSKVTVTVRIHLLLGRSRNRPHDLAEHRNGMLLL